MSHRYAPLPNAHSDTQRNQEEEMAAAFDYSDDEDDEHNTSETQPLNPQPSRNPGDTSIILSPVSQPQPIAIPRNPGTYDFENVDYDYPPPGSPPRPSAIALPNEYGNSNGMIPSFDSIQLPRQNWLQRTAASLLPSNIASRIGVYSPIPSGPVGGGNANDGVFANVTAKPTPPTRIQDGDSTYLVPEEAGREAPPSYAVAQADAVPPYWETTVHAPFSPDSAGEMIIDSLPTGSVFSFLWNMLVSVSFQFVGFLLTYLLHTSHAARLGSRAGLGVTLIQYGFALRGKMDSTEGEAWDAWRDPSRPTFGSSAEADAWFNEHAGFNNNATATFPLPDDQTVATVADATTEWLSFFLMTVGWFILLTSLLGFWRVKRWERGILASQRESDVAAQASSTVTPNLAVSRLEQVFGLRSGPPGDLFRQGFGFGNRQHQEETDNSVAIVRAEEGESRTVREPVIPMNLDTTRPDRSRVMLAALDRERRLQQELRTAGLL